MVLALSAVRVLLLRVAAALQLWAALGMLATRRLLRVAAAEAEAEA